MSLYLLMKPRLPRTQKRRQPKIQTLLLLMQKRRSPKIQILLLLMQKRRQPGIQIYRLLQIQKQYQQHARAPRLSQLSDR